MTLSARAIGVQGLSLTPRLIAVQGLWPYSYGPGEADLSAGRSRARFDDRIDELDDLLRRYKSRRRALSSVSDRESVIPAFTYATDAEAANRVQEAIAALLSGDRISDAAESSLDAILIAARQRVADEHSRRTRNRWRALLLTVLLVMS